MVARLFRVLLGITLARILHPALIPSRSRNSISLTTGPLLVDHDRSQQNSAAHQILIKGVDIEQIHHVLCGTKNEDADDYPQIVALPPLSETPPRTQAEMTLNSKP